MSTIQSHAYAHEYAAYACLHTGTHFGACIWREAIHGQRPPDVRGDVRSAGTAVKGRQPRSSGFADGLNSYGKTKDS